MIETSMLIVFSLQEVTLTGGVNGDTTREEVLVVLAVGNEPENQTNRTGWA